MEFTRETQGTNTYLVYQIEENEKIDTLSLGMIVNNKIDGIAPVIYNQLDSKKFLKYNISAKVPLQQYFMGTVNKKRLLGAFRSIVEGLLAAEDYMIDLSLFLLDLENIFVDVSTAETLLICIPTMKESKPADLGMFFKQIMFNSCFDPSENGDYIAKIIAHLNSAEQLSLSDFKNVIEELQTPAVISDKVSRPQPIMVQPVQPKVITPPKAPVPVQQEVNKPVQKTVPAQEVEPQAVKPTAVKPSAAKSDMGFAIPGGAEIPQSKEKKGKEKKKKEKKVKEQKIKEPKIKKPKEKKSFGLFGKKKEKIEPAAEVNVPNAVSQVQPVIPPQNAPVAPPAAPVQNTGRYADVMVNSANFGETTVLGNGSAGETVVLSNMGVQGKTQPYLTSVRKGEQIVINKPIFRIGKERSYVDYFIGDNPAISRSHANIIKKEDGYYIEDTNSTNHTYVNGQVITGGEQVKLEPDTQIRLGNEEFVFRY